MSKIGVFDSGFGGLTVLKAILHALPEYDYVYLGDNARAPYGNRPTETIYEYTLDAVKWLLEEQDCDLVILACNTASANALRKIQQFDLEKINPNKRVLGVIRPTAEIAHLLTKSKKIGVLGTQRTIDSEYYVTEIAHFSPDLEVYEQACPTWAGIIEANAMDTSLSREIFKTDVASLMQQDKEIDTILLACTHYPLIQDKIQQLVGDGIQVVSQGTIIAQSLIEYLSRHQSLEEGLSRNKTVKFYTTGDQNIFNENGSLFFGAKIDSKHVNL